MKWYEKVGQTSKGIYRVYNNNNNKKGEEGKNQCRMEICEVVKSHCRKARKNFKELALVESWRKDSCGR